MQTTLVKIPIILGVDWSSPFESVHAINNNLFQLGFPNLDQKYILALLRSLSILGLIDPDLQFRF